jgi:molybdopterin-guanine dinucleotide biosynthesis protein A
MGKPKAWLPFGDELMLPRVVRLLGDALGDALGEALGEAAGPIVVVAAPEQDVPPLPAAVAIVRDEERGRGPLEGLAAGLTALQGRADAAYLSSCDVPFLRPAFVRRLAELLGERQICVPHVGDFHHPLAAVYRLDVLPVVRRLLHANRLRPVYLFDEVRTRIVHADELLAVDPGLQTLRNLNTPEDYAAALAELAAPA